jgi:ABC-type transport system involved in multi-copper enzyme maturation permease subunit
MGPGPVFAYKWLMTTRRWQLYALRAIFVSSLLIGMMVVWQFTPRRESPGQTVSIETLASYGEEFYLTIVSIELTLVLLAASAATAGAVCLDKARGMLDHLLATDLSNAEIVLGKLGVRLVPVVGLIACVFPIMALSGLLGGIDPNALFGSFLTAVGCAVLGCALAFLLSVWGRKTHEVLILTYLVVILWMSSPLLLLLMVGAYLVGVRSPGEVSQTLQELTVYSSLYYRFIRFERACGLKKADMLIPLGVVSRSSKPGGQHADQSVVPCLRRPRVQVCAFRVREWSSDLYDL